jgi:hypothetical protein
VGWNHTVTGIIEQQAAKQSRDLVFRDRCSVSLACTASKSSRSISRG